MHLAIGNHCEFAVFGITVKIGVYFYFSKDSKLVEFQVNLVVL